MIKFVLKYGLFLTIFSMAGSIALVIYGMVKNDQLILITFSFLLGFALFSLLIQCLPKRKKNIEIGR